MRIWAGWLFLRPATIRPRSYLCIRCRDVGLIIEADLSSADSCRAHLAEDRINYLIKQSGAWWS